MWGILALLFIGGMAYLVTKGLKRLNKAIEASNRKSREKHSEKEKMAKENAHKRQLELIGNAFEEVVLKGIGKQYRLLSESIDGHKLFIVPLIKDDIKSSLLHWFDKDGVKIDEFKSCSELNLQYGKEYSWSGEPGNAMIPSGEPVFFIGILLREGGIADAIGKSIEAEREAIVSWKVNPFEAQKERCF